MNSYNVSDSSHLMHRMYHTAKDILKNKLSDMEEDERVEAISNMATYLMITTTNNLIKNGQRCFVSLFDMKGSTSYRKALDENYKNDRVYNNPCIPKIKEKYIAYCSIMNIPTIMMNGYEADDLAYFLSRSVSDEILFISEDADWKSNVIDNKILLMPIKKIEINFNTLLTTNKKVVDEIIDYRGLSNSNCNMYIELSNIVHDILNQKKAIYGDSSDNISGFKGIGPATILEVLIAINTIGLENYKPRKKAIKNMMNDIERYHNNIKVLGYHHVMEDKDRIKSLFDSVFDGKSSSIVVKDINHYFENVIKSKDLFNKIEGILEIFSKYQLVKPFNWTI